MHTIDGPGATEQNAFTKGNPANGTPATVVTDDWLNATQEEIANVIETALLTLNKEDNTQLYQAIQLLIANATQSSGLSTGDVKFTIKIVADPGWILLNDGTIGPSGSGATTRANDDTEALYTLVWDNISDTHAPVAGGRGVDAEADWAAGKLLTLPKALGRALGVAGAGAGLTARSLGQVVGTETHLLTVAELPAHVHTEQGVSIGGDQAGGAAAAHNAVNQNTGSAGGGEPHPNMQPTLFVNTMIKL